MPFNLHSFITTTVMIEYKSSNKQANQKIFTKSISVLINRIKTDDNSKDTITGESQGISQNVFMFSLLKAIAKKTVKTIMKASIIYTLFY